MFLCLTTFVCILSFAIMDVITLFISDELLMAISILFFQGLSEENVYHIERKGKGTRWKNWASPCWTIVRYSPHYPLGIHILETILHITC